MIQGANNYKLVDVKTKPNTLIFEGAVSAVEVHIDDMGTMDFMPMMLVVKTVSSPFKKATVRMLGEGRISDATTGAVLVKTLRLHKGVKVNAEANKLTFKDVKPALDAWLSSTKNNLYKLKNNVI